MARQNIHLSGSILFYHKEFPCKNQHFSVWLKYTTGRKYN